MPKAPLPRNEDARIAALRRYEILDSPTEAEFDDLTFLASEICETPIAIISLIDSDRQWYKSKRGVEISETSRDFAFCTYALLSGEFIEVPDARKDARFSDNPFVVEEPKVRFYAGGPLVTPEGMVLGTLCVVDLKPRQLTPGQRQGLESLSRQVIRQMELRLASRQQNRLREEISALNDNLENLVIERTRKLQESEERHRALAESANDAIVSTDHKSFIVSWNKAAERIFGYSSQEAVGKHIFLIIPERYRQGDQEGMRCYLKPGNKLSLGKTVEVTGLHQDGHEFPLELSASTWHTKAGQYFTGILRDLTDQKEIEKNRLRAQRLESLGTLSSGIAHDLNNALTPILMGLTLLRLKKDPKELEIIDSMEVSARHSAAMVRHLVTFAKGVEGERLLIQPRHLFSEIASMIKCTFPKNIELRCKYETKPLKVLGDATQLHQVLLNLCVNARDAMPHGGILSLEVCQKEFSENQPGMPIEAKPGKYIVCSVRDTGSGISTPALERIFEPFYTTKGPEKGTGLGLSTAMGIIKSHGGFIQVSSVMTKGSTFSVFLPLADSKTTRGNFLESHPSFLRGHGEMILVVDDDREVRQMMRAVLTGANYRVITAEDGTDALIQVAEHQTHLRGIITDVHMPFMGGSNFVRVLQRMMPEVGVLVSSGYLEEKEIREFSKLGVEAILEKPFTQEDLIAKVGSILSP